MGKLDPGAVDPTALTSANSCHTRSLRCVMQVTTRNEVTAMTTRDQARPPYDSESEVAAVTVGSGILLTQTFALFPGLLPCLLLLLPLVLPLVVLGIVGGLLIGLPLGMWRLTAWVARSLRGSRSLPAPLNPQAGSVPPA